MAWHQQRFDKPIGRVPAPRIGIEMVKEILSQASCTAIDKRRSRIVFFTNQRTSTAT
jgi:hypothetical protein